LANVDVYTEDGISIDRDFRDRSRIPSGANDERPKQSGADYNTEVVAVGKRQSQV
jgi:hypothetical protein